ncbi:MAG: pur operon repressor [Thermoanaerobacteraceae bacterium]
MNKYKRYERIAVMFKVFSENPNTVIKLEYFMKLFDMAKSSSSEDIEILRNIIDKFGYGKLLTISGAGGGIKYLPFHRADSYKPFIEELCFKLKDKSRIIPGGFLYTSDLIYSPSVVTKIGELLAMPFQDKDVDAVVTVETKGIPIALMSARALNVPLVIARKDSKVTEGSFVSINYVSGSQKRIRTMSLSRRSLKRGSRVLIIDDFMKAGGTIKGMSELMDEFEALVLGAGVMISTKEPENKLVDNYYSIFVLDDLEEDTENIKIEISDLFLNKNFIS